MDHDELADAAAELRRLEHAVVDKKLEIARRVEQEIARGVPKTVVSRRIGYHTATVLRWTRRLSGGPGKARAAMTTEGDLSAA